MQPAAFAEDGVAVLVRFAGDDRKERAPKVGVGWADAGERLDCGGNVNQLDECVGDARLHGDAARWLDDEWHARDAVLERVLGLLDEAVVAGEIAVVGEEEDGGVVVEAGLAEGVEDETELVVDAGAHGVVDGAELVPAIFG